MSPITYRDATAGDAAMVADLFARTFVETFGHLYSEEDLGTFLAGVTAEAYAAEIADPAFEIRLAFAQGDAVAFAKLGPPSLPEEPPPNTLELWQIYVLGSWQGNGIGPALFDWAAGRARGRGAEHLQLTVYVENYRAKTFYERRGFVPTGRYAFMVGNHADEDIIMRCVL
ncbi:MAG TPA: GNAT family N-acetyltransferase [Sphingomicrobium sp.]|nr:GNAT family N-acetyltransferase [Sphingomicrobium sp.]